MLFACLPQPHDACRDMQYICIKAAAAVDEDGMVDEREYWLPLDKHQTVADFQKFMVGGMLERAGQLYGAGDDERLARECGWRTLDDSNTVVEEGITDNTTLHLMVRKDANITVKMRGTKDSRPSSTPTRLPGR